MIRAAVVCAGLVAGLLTLPAATVDAAQGVAPSAGQISAADAAPFVGTWTLTLEGPNGPATFELSVKVEQDKVAGEIKSAELPAQAIADITKVDKSLILRYSFDYQGNQVPTIVSLTPAEEGKTKAQIDFAGGAYVMAGSAAKKEPAK